MRLILVPGWLVLFHFLRILATTMDWLAFGTFHDQSSPLGRVPYCAFDDPLRIVANEAHGMSLRHLLRTTKPLILVLVLTALVSTEPLAVRARGMEDPMGSLAHVQGRQSTSISTVG